MSTASSVTRLKTLSDFLSGIVPVDAELPLVHITKSEYVDQIIGEKALVPRTCPVFSEPLVYLFYGRPAYRINHPSSKASYCPVCFIFKPYICLDSFIRRIYPFDSGASKSGRFEPYITNSITEQYELRPSIESARRVISFFFESNLNYYSGDPRPSLTFGPDEMIPANYYALVSDDNTGVFDDRRSCIELQVHERLPLRDALLTVVVPRVLLDREDFRKTVFKEWRTFPIDYNTVRGAPTSECTSIIRQRLQDFLSDKGYLG